MRDAIINVLKQFAYEPQVENVDHLKRWKKFVVCGMGGSHLAGDLLKLLKPTLDIVIHSDYGLRAMLDLKERLVIVSSYSGNTEEVIDNVREARRRKLSVAVIASGGKLIALAKQFQIPCVVLPSGVQPRMAIGYSLLGMLKLMGENRLVTAFHVQGSRLRPAQFEQQGKRLANVLSGAIPILYSSVRNKSLAYYWKITLNETGKIPAFCNVFPEVNHNEMQGFASPAPLCRSLLHKRGLEESAFTFIFLQDQHDHPRIKKRMRVMKQMFEDRNMRVEIVSLKGTTTFEKVFNTVFHAAWTAYYLARRNRQDPETVPLIEEFKQSMRSKRTS